MKFFGEKSVSSILYWVSILGLVIAILAGLLAFFSFTDKELITEIDFNTVTFQLKESKYLTNNIKVTDLILSIIYVVFCSSALRLFYAFINEEIFVEKNFKIVNMFAITTLVASVTRGFHDKFTIEFINSYAINNSMIEPMTTIEVILIYGALAGVLEASTILLIGFGIKKGLEYKEENDLTI